MAIAWSVSIGRVFGNHGVVKQVLADSDIYGSGTDAIIEHGIKQAEDKTDIPLDDPAVRQAIEDAVSLEVVRQNSEHVLDSIYSWLSGETKQPNFAIDMQTVKNDIAKNISQAGKARVEKLPACTLTQLQQLNLDTINPFTIPCRPVGVDLERIRALYERQIAQSDAFLTDPLITADDLKDESGQPVFANIAAPTHTAWDAFAWFLPAFIGAVQCAIGIVFLRPTKRSGVKLVSILALVSAALIIIGALMSNGLLSALNPASFGEAETADLQASVLEVTRELSNIINRYLFIFAAAYAVGGIVGLFALHFFRTPASVPVPSNTPQS